MSQHQSYRRETAAVHVAVIQAMYDLLVRDPSRIRFMQTKEEDSLDALGITRLIKSPS